MALAFESLPYATPSPAVEGRPVHFSATANQTDLTWQWQLGGQAVLHAEQGFHVFAAPGTYLIKVSASNSFGDSVSSDFDLVVEPKLEDLDGDGIEDAVDEDKDGDGFSNNLETALGTQADDATSTPFNGASAGVVKTLGVGRMQIKLYFNGEQKDQILLKGSLEIASEVDWAGQKVVVDVGGVVKTFELDEKGRGPRGLDQFRVRATKPPKGGGPRRASFILKLSKGAFLDAFSDEGLEDSGQQESRSKHVLITILMDQSMYKKTQTQTYRVTPGKAGLFK